MGFDVHKAKKVRFWHKIRKVNPKNSQNLYQKFVKNDKPKIEEWSERNLC